MDEELLKRLVIAIESIAVDLKMMNEEGIAAITYQGEDSHTN